MYDLVNLNFALWSELLQQNRKDKLWVSANCVGNARSRFLYGHGIDAPYPAYRSAVARLNPSIFPIDVPSVASRPAMH